MANTVEIIIKGEDQASRAISGVKGALGGLSGGLQSAGKAMMDTGAKMSVGITAPLLLIGKNALSTAGDFEGAMNILGVAAGDASVSMGDLSKAALAVGKDTSLVGIDASEAANAMTNFYKAGLTTSDVFSDLQGYLAGTTELTGALRSAIDLAAASDLDLAFASDAVAIAMATFGINADEAAGIANSFVGAADASTAEVSDLVEAMKNVGPTMASFGYSLEDTNTALAILSTRGIKGAEAGTSLKSMMTNLMRPTKDVTGALKELDVSLYDADGTMRSMPEIIGDLGKAMAGMTQEQRNQYIQTLAGTYGMKAMATLLDEGVVGWEEMESAIGNAASAQEVGAARTQGFNAAMEQLGGAIETLMITAITPLLPKITGLVNTIGDFVGKLIEADPQLVQMGIVIAAVAAAAGPLLMALGAISTVLGAVLSPIGLVVAAIAALGLAWATNFLGIRDVLTELWETTIQPIFQKIMWVIEGFINFLSGTPEGMKQFMTAIQFAFGLTAGEAYTWVETIRGVIATVVGFFTETIPQAVSQLGEILLPVWFGIKSIIASVIDEIVPKIVEGFGVVALWFAENWPAIQAVIEEVWGAILSVIQTVINTVVPFIVAQFGVIVAWVNENWPLIKQTITTVLDGVLNVVQSVISWIRNFWETNHDAIMTVATSVWNIIKNSISTIINAILGIIKAVMLAISGDWDAAWLLIKQVALDYWEALKTNFDETMTAVKTILDLILPKIQELWDTVWTAIKEKAIEIWDDIKEFVDTTLKAINQTITRILSNTFNWIVSKVSDWIQAGKDLVGGMAQGITDTIQKVVDAGKGIMNALKEAILSVQLPIPTVSLTWETWHGIKYPSVGFGVKWQTIGSLVAGNAPQSTGNGGNSAQGAMAAAANNTLSGWGITRGAGNGFGISKGTLEDFGISRGTLEDFGIVRTGGGGKTGAVPIGFGEGIGEATGGIPSSGIGGSGGGSGGGGVVAVIAGNDPNSAFASSDLEYKIAGLTA